MIDYGISPKGNIVILHITKDLQNANHLLLREKGFMDWEIFKKVVDECSAEHTHSLSLYMLGEPLMHPNIRQMINYAKKMALPYVDVSTNALVDMRPLLGTALDELIISLDGINPLTYQKNRSGDFEKIENNISLFLEAKAKGSYEYPFVRMQIIDMPSNRPYIDDFVKKWLPKADLVYIKKLEGMVQGLGDKLVDSAEIEKTYRDRQPCKQLFYTHNINWNGDHAFCCHDPFGKSLLGNIRNTTIKEAWSSNEKLAEVERQSHNVFAGLCQNCVDYGAW